MHTHHCYTDIACTLNNPIHVTNMHTKQCYTDIICTLNKATQATCALNNVIQTSTNVHVHTHKHTHTHTHQQSCNPEMENCPIHNHLPTSTGLKCISGMLWKRWSVRESRKHSSSGSQLAPSRKRPNTRTPSSGGEGPCEHKRTQRQSVPANSHSEERSTSGVLAPGCSALLFTCALFSPLELALKGITGKHAACVQAAAFTERGLKNRNTDSSASCHLASGQQHEALLA